MNNLKLKFVLVTFPFIDLFLIYMLDWVLYIILAVQCVWNSPVAGLALCLVKEHVKGFYSSNVCQGKLVELNNISQEILVGCSKKTKHNPSSWKHLIQQIIEHVKVKFI